jgi:hypothetical protein
VPAAAGGTVLEVRCLLLLLLLLLVVVEAHTCML